MSLRPSAGPLRRSLWFSRGSGKAPGGLRISDLANSYCPPFNFEGARWICGCCTNITVFIPVKCTDVLLTNLQSIMPFYNCETDETVLYINRDT